MNERQRAPFYETHHNSGQTRIVNKFIPPPLTATPQLLLLARYVPNVAKRSI